MNKVILTGRFTRDPESRMGSNSLEISRFSLACSSDFVNRNGERQTEFINCTAFGNTASTINKFCKKGQQISAVGRISNSSYDGQDGKKVYRTDIIVESFEFLGAKSGGADMGGASAPFDNNASFDTNNLETTDVTEDPYKDFGEEVNISSDDLPF